MEGIDNKTKFLNDIAKSLGRDRKTVNDLPNRSYSLPPKKQYENDHEKYQQLFKTFKKTLIDLDGQVIEIQKEADLQFQLSKQINDHNVKQVVMWDDPRFHQVGLVNIFNQQDVSVVTWTGNNSDHKLTMLAEQSQIGITWADGAFAETGTLLLQNGGGKGRLVSLLPKVHLVFIEINQLESSWTDAMQHMKTFRNRKQWPSCTNFISGPSTSADIQLETMKGVHGPSEFVVMVLNLK